MAVSKISAPRYAVVEGTLPTTTSTWSDTVAYPTGFTQSNSAIAGFSIKVDSTSWRTGVGLFSNDAVRVFAELSSYGVHAYITDSSLVSRPFRVVLVKIS